MVGGWKRKPSNMSEVVSPTNSSCSQAFGYLCAEVADLAWEKSSCFFHPTTVALIIGRLEMSSRKSLPIIFFFLIRHTNYDSRIVKSIDQI